MSYIFLDIFASVLLTVWLLELVWFVGQLVKYYAIGHRPAANIIRLRPVRQRSVARG